MTPVRLLPDVVEEHAEEAAVIWNLRSKASTWPHISLNQLTEWDERLEAHLDGLRVAGEDGWRISIALLLQQGGAAETFVAGVLACTSQLPELKDSYLKLIDGNVRCIPGAVSAAAWTDSSCSSWFSGLQTHPNAALRLVAVAACDTTRFDPESVLHPALRDVDAVVRARAMRAVGELGCIGFIPELRAALGSDNSPTCVFWAAWSLMLLGDRTALDLLAETAISDSPMAERAICLLGVCRSPCVPRLFKELALNSRKQRQAITLATLLGEREHINWLIEKMPDPAVARACGDAFRQITGTPIFGRLKAPRPTVFPQTPSDDPEDEEVELDHDEHLSWPNMRELKQLWCERQSAFAAGVRYFLGQPVTVSSLKRILKHGLQPERAAAALELAVRNPGGCLFDVAASAARQRELLTAFCGAAE